MGEICTACNGLEEIDAVCPNCREKMDNMGRMEDYQGPYSPYMDRDSFSYNNTANYTGDNCCIHLYVCPNCRSLSHFSVALKSI